MAQQLTPINVAGGDTFNTLYVLANTVVSTIATVVVTANNSVNGAITTGNGYISGYLGASNLVAGNGIQGGSIANSANLNVTSNLIFTNASSVLVVGNNVINSSAITANNLLANNATIYNFTLSTLSLGNTSIGSFTYHATSTTLQTIDYFSKSAYRSAEYILSLEDGGSNNFECTKLLVVHNGTNAFITEYGMVISNTSLGVISATTNTSSILIQLTPATSNVWIMGTRTTLTL